MIAICIDETKRWNSDKYWRFDDNDNDNYKFNRRIVLDCESKFYGNIKTAQRHDQEEETDLILTTAKDSIEQKGRGYNC